MGEPPKKVYPPGWNDPPMLNYSQANPPPKSRITNKRVAFPVGASTPVQSNSPAPSFAGNVCVDDLYSKANENYEKLLNVVTNEEVKTQVREMLIQWREGKLSSNVQELLVDLSVNVLLKNSVAINEIHLKLAMLTDDVLLKTYLPALKYLSS